MFRESLFLQCMLFGRNGHHLRREVYSLLLLMQVILLPRPSPLPQKLFSPSHSAHTQVLTLVVFYRFLSLPCSVSMALLEVGLLSSMYLVRMCMVSAKFFLCYISMILQVLLESYGSSCGFTSALAPPPLTLASQRRRGSTLKQVSLHKE